MSDPASIAQRPAAALETILALFDGGTAPVDALTRIRAIAEEAAAYDHDRMRLRFDDLHGNRCFVQRIDGEWIAYDPAGKRLHLVYAFGSPMQPITLRQDLDAATTMGGMVDAAMRHMKRLNDVQVEAVWERHQFDGTKFLQSIPIQAAAQAA